MGDRLQTFAANRRGRDFTVGDIHGCFYMLDALLERIGFDATRDRLFSVGDLIDRGPDSERAAEFLAADWFYAIRGNHEQMMLDAVANRSRLRGGRARRLWRINGGDWFKSLSNPEQEALADAVAPLPYAIEIALADGGLAVLVHADVVDDSWPTTRRLLTAPNPGDDQWLSWLIWERDRAYRLEQRLRGETRPVAVDGVDLIAFGHTPIAAPVACGNTRWLDTGAVHGHRLSIAELGIAGEVWSLAADMYTFHTGWREC